jgi:hypothetical protein
MSNASDTFAQSILDADNLLKHFERLSPGLPPQDLEVLKRAGLIMAMTAWETYVEDRILEAAEKRLSALDDKSIASFMRSKLDEEIKRLHNPTSAKTIELFRDYAGADLKVKWAWNGMDEKAVRDRLDKYIKIRGEAVHRSRQVSAAQPQAHLVNKEALAKAIGFLKQLVKTTETALESAHP